MKLATGEFQKPEKMDRSSNSNNGLAANFAERDSTQKVREGLTDRQTDRQRQPSRGTLRKEGAPHSTCPAAREARSTDRDRGRTKYVRDPHEPAQLRLG